MTVTFYAPDGEGYEQVGRVEDGEIVEDGEGEPLESALAVHDLSDEQELLLRFRGPGLIAQSTVGADREMQAAVPQGAISIPDPSAAPAGTQVVQGPRGGWYYVPGAGDDAATGGEEAQGVDTVETHFPEPDEDIPRFVNDAELVERVTEFNDRDEWGFTLNADLTNYEGGGFIVTVSSRATTKEEYIGSDEVVEFYETWLPVLRVAPEQVKIGGWAAEQGDDYKSIDLNVVLPAEQEALAVALGREFNQQAIFNADTFEVVETGGTGEPPTEDPTEVARLVEAVLAESELRKRLQDEAEGMDVAGPLFGEHAEQNETMYVSDSGERVRARTIYLRIRSGRYELLDTAEGGRIAIRDTEAGTETMFTQAENVTDHGTSGMQRQNAEGDESPFRTVPDPTPEEAAFHAIFEGCVWSDDTETRMLAFAPSTMPENVRDRLLEAVREGVIFNNFEDIDRRDRQRIVNAFADSLATGEGWTTSELAAQIHGSVEGIDRDAAFRIARTELAAVTNEAREIYYRDEGILREAEFRWSGPQDHRTTEACEWLKRQTQSGVSFERLLELEEEASERFFPELSFRKHVIHPFERHTYVRHYDINEPPADVPA